MVEFRALWSEGAPRGGEYETWATRLSLEDLVLYDIYTGLHEAGHVWAVRRIGGEPLYLSRPDGAAVIHRYIPVDDPAYALVCIAGLAAELKAMLVDGPQYKRWLDVALASASNDMHRAKEAWPRSTTGGRFHYAAGAVGLGEMTWEDLWEAVYELRPADRPAARCQAAAMAWLWVRSGLREQGERYDPLRAAEEAPVLDDLDVDADDLIGYRQAVVRALVPVIHNMEDLLESRLQKAVNTKRITDMARTTYAFDGYDWPQPVVEACWGNNGAPKEGGQR